MKNISKQIVPHLTDFMLNNCI